MGRDQIEIIASLNPETKRIPRNPIILSVIVANITGYNFLCLPLLLRV